MKGFKICSNCDISKAVFRFQKGTGICKNCAEIAENEKEAIEVAEKLGLNPEPEMKKQDEDLDLKRRRQQYLTSKARQQQGIG